MILFITANGYSGQDLLASSLLLQAFLTSSYFPCGLFILNDKMSLTMLVLLYAPSLERSLLNDEVGAQPIYLDGISLK